MIKPTREQRAEMAAFIDAREPGWLDELGISRHDYCSRCDGPGPRPRSSSCPECGCATPYRGNDLRAKTP